MKIIRLTESQLKNIIKESVCHILTEKSARGIPAILYHKSPISSRKSILKQGLIPSVGSSYKAHWDDRDDLTPLIFLYDHNNINNGEYDSTYDDDIYAVDSSQLDRDLLTKDPDKTMKGCFAYSGNIPKSALKLLYKGSRKDSDERLMVKHSHIYENTLQDHIEIEESTGEYGDINISAYVNGQLAGYLILVIHKDITDLDSEISDTDSPETAMMVVRKLDYNKPTIELADIDVKKEFRSQGLSKILLEYTLNNFQGYQFYLRVCPTDGVDEQTFANSFIKYGFIVVDRTENGTFLIKK